MNQHFLIDEEIKVFRQNHPEYSYGQMLYAAIRCIEKKTGSSFHKKDLVSLTDKDIYSAISLAVVIEREEFFDK